MIAKKIYLFFVLLYFCNSHPIGASTIIEGYSFNVKEKQYLFSTYFEMASSKKPQGAVVKSAFSVRTNYDFYNSKGLYQSTGISRILCLGAFYSWGSEIDIYDSTGNKIGMIDGQVATTAAARFSIYDQNNQLIGIAFLDQEFSGFTISHPESNAHWIARLTRNFTENVVDCWNVEIYEPDAIDEGILKIFAAFAVDHQKHFKEDN